MGEKSLIEWTDATWNPWIGCTKVSPGCDNCYMFRGVTRTGYNPQTVRRAKDATFYAPLHWKGSKRIFTCSWSDFFHHDADEWREDAWNIIQRTPWHTYQILTKRPGLMVDWANKHGWPNNCWAGVSVESQKYAPRLDVLARVSAPIRFVSCEPLLGSLDLSKWLHTLGWVIVGGESGPNARPMHLQWARDIIRQCQSAGVPPFCKQLGRYPYEVPESDGATGYFLHLRDAKGGAMVEWPNELRVRGMPAPSLRMPEV